MKKDLFARKAIGLALISGAAFGYFLFFSDPRQGAVVITIFLITVFVLVASLVSLFAHIIRKFIIRDEVMHLATRASVREGLLAAIYVVAVLELSQIELLTWWDAMLLALSLVLFEVYFSSGKEPTR